MNQTTIRRLLASTLLAVTALGSGCEDPATDEPDVVPRSAPAPHDAGDVSFVRQAVPALLGRKVRGHAELAVLTDLIAAVGRHRVVSAITAQPDYVDYWRGFWMDELLVNRAGHKIAADCYGPPIRGSDGGALARILQNADPQSGTIAAVGPINMSDVLVSSLEEDDISVPYRANLFPLLKHNMSNAAEVDEFALRRQTSEGFTNAYTRRNSVCLGCHSSSSSITGPGSGWDRTFPVFASEDSLLFRNGSVAQQNVDALFRSDVQPGFASPFGLVASCGTFLPPAYLGPDPEGHTAALTEDYGNTGSVWDVESQIRQGVERFRVVGGLTRSGGVPVIQQDRVLAGRMASHISDQVWTELMGYPLTIAHSYSRNRDQRDQLVELTDWFVRMEFSPRWLLRTIVLSSYFNRKAPAQHGGDPYDIPAVFDPWVVAPPSVSNPPSAEQYNSMTDGIHAYSARNLMHSVATTMGWPTVEDFPDTAYPSRDFASTMGLYIRDSEPGARGVGFGNLLAWDDVIANGSPKGPNDWVERVVASVPAFDAANPGSPLTFRDLVKTTKDWVLGDGTIGSVTTGGGSVEADTLGDYFGADLDDPVASLSPTELEDVLRGLVGVYLQSPQYMLAGAVSPLLGPEPRLRVCTDGPCTYQQICEAYRPGIESGGYDVTCGASSIVVEPRANGALAFPGVLCGGRPCVFMEGGPKAGCATNPWDCMHAPPPCDPRCTVGPRCCGDLRMTDTLDGMFVLWGEGGILEAGEGVRVLPVDGEEWATVEGAHELAYGDLLEVSAGAEFFMELPDGEIVPPEEGIPENPESGVWYFLVSGPEAVPEVDEGPGTQEGFVPDWEGLKEQWWLRNGARPPG